MKLFWCPRTRASRAVWLLEEAGVPYELVHINISDPVSRARADFQRASPMGKVPALEDGEVHMADSAAMALYVADRYASGRLAPSLDAPERGRFLYWMFYGPAVMEPAMAEKVGGWPTHRGRNGWGDFDTMLATLEQALGDQAWIMGESFSVADVVVGSTVGFMRMFNMLPGSSVLHRYADRCAARPGYRQAIAMDA
jgi:glutathione S-transferase